MDFFSQCQKETKNSTKKEREVQSSNVDTTTQQNLIKQQPRKMHLSFEHTISLTLSFYLALSLSLSTWKGQRDMNVPRLSLPMWAIIRTSLLPAIIILVNARAQPAVPSISRSLLYSQVAPLSQFSTETEAQSPGRALPLSLHLGVFELSVFLLLLILYLGCWDFVFGAGRFESLLWNEERVSGPVEACVSLLKVL